MCGILGCVTQPDAVNGKDFQISLDTIAHRGPDDQGWQTDRHLDLGLRPSDHAPVDVR